jgi:hypothetical protein
VTSESLVPAGNWALSSIHPAGNLALSSPQAKAAGQHTALPISVASTPTLRSRDHSVHY